MGKKIGGCVVLFHPGPGVAGNINSYCDNLDVLLIIDNSPARNDGIADQLSITREKIQYHWMGKNEGIAMALNKAASLALADQCDWLLTMDQDSSFLPGDFERMSGYIDEINGLYSRVGIIGAYQNVHTQFLSHPGEKFSEIRTTMTSGNLLNLKAYVETGAFENKFFIDYVDHEYCLRLRKHGYKVVQVNGIHLNHSLGKFEVRNLLGKKIGTSNHNPTRRYYIARNGLYTAFKYFRFDNKFSRQIFVGLVNDFFRIVFFEPNKFLKIKAMIKGAYDSMFNRFGVRN